MKFYFCDTSAVVKRYHEEKGTGYMDSLFESEANMAISSLQMSKELLATVNSLA